MNSFNHYSYGAIGDWMYRVMVGIDTAADGPGYKHILIQPQPGGGITHARAALKTVYGEVVSAWQLTDDDFRLQVTVPPNTRATLRIPATDLAQVTEGGAAVQGRVDGGVVVVEVGAGQYSFVSTGLTLAQAMAHVRHVAGRIDVASSLRDVLANERARAVLVKYIGEDALKAPTISWVMDQPLDALRRFAPQALTPEVLAAMQKDLTALQ